MLNAENTVHLICQQCLFLYQALRKM